MAVQEKIRVKIRSYEHTLADQAAAKIAEIAKKNGAEISGPIPLPTEKEIITILAADTIRDQILEDVNRNFGLRTEAQAIICAVPVDRAFKI